MKIMKSIVIALLIVVSGASIVCAALETWTVSNYIDDVAKQVQSQIPKVSFDGLFEAKREKGGWSYTYWNCYGKTWAEEIHIKLIYVDQKQTRIEVEAFRKENGMVFSHKEDKPELKEEAVRWLKEIK